MGVCNRRRRRLESKPLMEHGIPQAGGGPFGSVTREMTNIAIRAKIGTSHATTGRTVDDSGFGSLRADGRNAHDANVKPAMTRGTTHLAAGSPAKRWEAAAPV